MFAERFPWEFMHVPQPGPFQNIGRYVRCAPKTNDGWMDKTEKQPKKTKRKKEKYIVLLTHQQKCAPLRYTGTRQQQKRNNRAIHIQTHTYIMQQASSTIRLGC